MTTSATRDQATGKFVSAVAEPPTFTGPPLAGLYDGLPAVADLRCDWCPRPARSEDGTPEGPDLTETYANPGARSFTELWQLAADRGWVTVPLDSGDGSLYVLRMCPGCKRRWRESLAAAEPAAPEMLPAPADATDGQMADCGSGTITLTPDAVTEVTPAAAAGPDRDGWQLRAPRPLGPSSYPDFPAVAAEGWDGEAPEGTPGPVPPGPPAGPGGSPEPRQDDEALDKAGGCD